MVGEPVIIGPRPKPKPVEPEPEPEPEVQDEPQAEVEEPEPEPEPERGIPQEVLDKVFAEIEEIERKTKLIKIELREAQEAKDEADKLKKQAEDIRAEAEKIRADAQAEADKLVADTKQQAKELLDKVHKEGYDAGYSEGRDKGIADGKEQIENDLKDIVRQANDNAQKTIQDAKEQTSEYFIRAEDEIAKVVMMAIEKILPQHFLDAPQVILPVVREAIKHVRDQKQIKVHVEPYSYDLILMARSEFQSMLTDGTALIEVVSDEGLKPGDCVIETPNGSVDARLSTRLELMKSAIQSVLNK